MDDPITVYYDGACGMCSREIRHYQRIAPQDRYAWVDITQTPEPLNALGISTEEGLRIMHVRDAAGEMHKGVDAFLVLWRAMPYWKILRPIVACPGIYHLACFSYARFANWRFKRLAHCKL